MARWALTFFVSIVLCATAAAQVVIDNARGADPRVDYTTLSNIGPWDDRNYALTLEDIRLLGPNEADLITPVPAFYRVMVRRQMPLRTATDFNYPRAAYNYFKHRYAGYLVDGVLYRKVRWNGRGYDLIADSAQSLAEVFNTRIFMGEQQLAQSAAESAISFNPVDPDLVVAGVNKAGQTQYYSSDGGETWTESADLFGGECCDPTLSWSSDGTKAYVATLGGSDVWFYRSDNNGATWDALMAPNGRVVMNGSGSDKEYMHVDWSDNSAFKDNVYLCWHDGNIQQFSVSDDFGETFTKQAFNGEPVGIGCDITTDDDGTIYFFYPAFGVRDIRLLTSDDGGATFSASTKVADTMASFDWPIPSMETRNAWIYVSADTDLTGGPFHDRVYAAWTDTTEPDNNANPQANHTVVHVAWSDDEGMTWNFSNPHPIADSMEVDRWNQWLKVDRNGVLHLVFYDTRAFEDRSGVDLYRSWSFDGGVSFSPPIRVTTESSPNAGGGFEFGDYNGLDFGADGGLSIFSDNRQPGVDVYIAYQPNLTDLIDQQDFE